MTATVYDLRYHSSTDLDRLLLAVNTALPLTQVKAEKESLLAYRIIVTQARDIATERERSDNVILEVDGNECTLSEFIRINTEEPDVDHISPEDVERVKALRVGEELSFGLGATVKRIK